MRRAYVDRVCVGSQMRCNRAATITGYRIFYDGKEIAFLPSIIVFNDFVTSISLNLGQGTKVGQTLSVRAESISQQTSELITVTISSELFLMHKFHYIEFLFIYIQHLMLYPALMVVVTVVQPLVWVLSFSLWCSLQQLL